MKCENCGAILPENSIRCRYCNHILQMVPDYNPLDEVLAEQVRSAIEGEEDIEQFGQQNRGQNARVNNRPNARPNSRSDNRSNARPNGKSNVRVNGTRTKESREVEIRKRREQERRLAEMKKKRMILIGAMVSGVVILSILIYVLYSNSYAGQIGKAEAAMGENNLKQAIKYYDIAIEKNPNILEAYQGKANAYILGGEFDVAEKVLLEAAAQNTDSIEINTAVIDYYMEYDQLEKIDPFLRGLRNDKVKEELNTYYSTVPEFSLDEGTYDDVQELTLTTQEQELHYTVDGNPATVDSPIYDGPIQLGEGTTMVKAISVNEKGIPSKEISREYIVELPIVMAPVVSPSTGQYKEVTTIKIQVPSGYTAYYTLDNTTPTTNSNVYSNPINMPEGNTIFTAILINDNGKSSDITKRNYDLVISKESED